MLKEVGILGASNSLHCSKSTADLSGKESTYATIKQLFAACAYGGVAYASMKASFKITDDYYSSCSCTTQSPACFMYQIAGVVTLALAALAVVKTYRISFGYGGWGASSAPIRNPSVIPSGPPQAQPNAFFRSQQNGGPARYAEDDLQGTHRRPLSNYDPVQWNGGSQSI